MNMPESEAARVGGYLVFVVKRQQHLPAVVPSPHHHLRVILLSPDMQFQDSQSA